MLGNNKHIEDFTEVAKDFKKIFLDITSQKFFADVTIIPTGYSDPSRKKIRYDVNPSILVNNSNKCEIIIERMPIHEFMYELSLQAGYTIKPHFKYKDNAEDVKAVFFQYMFGDYIKHSQFKWRNDFLFFEDKRITTSVNDPDITEYHRIAEEIRFLSKGDFSRGIEIIKNDWDELL